MSGGDSFLGPDELAAVGLGAVGRGVRLSRFARLYNPRAIALGDEVRIDDFSIISAGAGKVRLEGHNHVAAGAMIFGDVTMRPWSTLSSRVAVYAASDDFGVDATTYPHAKAPRVLTSAPVVIGSRVVIGTGSTVLPGVEIADGVSVGAMSLVRTSLLEPGVYAGIPARRLRPRRPLAPSEG